MEIDPFARARVVTLLAAGLSSLCAGSNYVYSAYAPQLGTRLHITYTQLNIIGLSGNMGVYTTGPILGRMVDRRGPRPLLAAAFFLLLIGYSGLRRYYDAGPSNLDKLPTFDLIVMSIFSYMTGVGGNSSLTASANATAKSFPERMRATTVGFILSGFGLSAFFFSTLAHWLFPGNTSSFLLFLGLGTSLPIVIGFFFVRTVPHAERPESTPGGFIWPSDADAVSSTSRLIADGTIAGQVGFHGREENDEGFEEAHETSVHPEIMSAVEVHRPRSRSVELSPSRRRGSLPRQLGKPKTSSEPVDKHGRQMLTGWEFWLIFTLLSLLSGTGLMFINNVGSISQALSAKGDPNYDKIAAGKLQAAQVSLISLANCGARIGIGAGADFLKSRYAAHRSYLLSLVSALFILSQIVCSQIENPKNLWQASILLGLGYGGIFSLLPTITIEWFGLAHFSENWGFVSLAPLLGGNLFSILFGRNLDAHVPDSASPGSSASEDTQLSSTSLHSRAPIPELGRQCLEGRICYSETLVITTFACVVALFLSLVAAWRDRRKVTMGNKYESLSQEVIWEHEAEEE